MPEADQRVLARPEVRTLFLRDNREAFRAGSRGPARDNAILVRPWGFRLEDVRVPVHVWQGGADKNVPASHGRYQAGAIPGATLHYYPDEGHLLVIERIGEIMDTIV
jgi:pimeloyl-ACP methyl ester carboxylesterase